MIRTSRVSTRAMVVVGTALVIATAAVGAIVTAGALATTPSGVTAETFRGTLREPLHVNTKLANDARVMLKTQEDVEIVTQRIVAQPGATFGWHTHPGPSLITVKTGTITAYEGDDPTCTGTVYTAGQTFLDEGDGHVHILRNETGSTAETIAVQILPAGEVRRIDGLRVAGVAALVLGVTLVRGGGS